MIQLNSLRDIELVPVLELDPWSFSTPDRPRPSGSIPETPEEWSRFWLDCLADAGIHGLAQLHPGSWHVPVRDLDNGETLLKMLRTAVGDGQSIGAPIEPVGVPILDGGLALFNEGRLLVAPTCCSDLGNISEWRSAAGYRESEWRTLWIGHPWLSVRYEGRLLVISEPHDSDKPSGRWVVEPGVLGRAVDAAEVKLEGFARRLAGAVAHIGAEDRAERLARRLAGLAP